ncbi:hypothetical protein BG004_004781, partial [Podila humilis]
MAEYHPLPDRAPHPAPVPYGAQQQPYYQPQQQQQYYGQPQPPQQQYYGNPPPPPLPQQQQHYVPPTYETNNTQGTTTINPETGLPTKFNPKPKYNDVWAIIVFAIQLVAFVVLSYFAISKVIQGRSAGGTGGVGTLDGLFAKTGLITMALGLVLGAIISVLYLLLTQA